MPKAGSRLPLSSMTSKHKIQFDSYINNEGNETFTATISHPEWDIPANALISVATDEYPNGFQISDDPTQEDYDNLMKDVLTNGVVLWRKREDDSEYQLIVKAKEKTTGFGAKKAVVTEEDEDVLPTTQAPVATEKAAGKKKAATK